MNPYFWLFSLYAFLITPIRVHVSVRIGKGVWYRVRLQAAGLPFVRKTDAPEAEEPVQQEDVARTLSGWQPFVQLVREERFKRRCASFTWKPCMCMHGFPLTMRLLPPCATQACIPC